MLEMRTSERGSLKRCAQQWYWAQVEGLRPNRAANPLWFGEAVHVALAGYYIPGTVRGPHPAETFTTFLKGNRSVIVTKEEEEVEYVDARELGIDMLNRYVLEYGDEEWKDYIAPEYQGNVIMSRPPRTLFGREQKPLRRWLKYHFTYDGIYRDLRTGEIWLDEHKTAASMWDDFLPLDDQAGSYWAVAGPLLRRKGVLRPDEEIAGIMYNFLRKAIGDTRPKNEDGLYTNKPTKQHFIDALYNHFGEDSPAEEMESWEKDLPKMKLNELEELAEIQGLTVLGDVSKSQPPEYFYRTPVYRSQVERKKMLERIKQEAQFAEAYRAGKLPILKSTSTMNCRGCPYRRMCELDETGDTLSVEEFKASQFHFEDPYEAYREQKSAE